MQRQSLSTGSYHSGIINSEHNNIAEFATCGRKDLAKLNKLPAPAAGGFSRFISQFSNGAAAFLGFRLQLQWSYLQIVSVGDDPCDVLPNGSLGKTTMSRKSRRQMIQSVGGATVTMAMSGLRPLAAADSSARAGRIRSVAAVVTIYQPFSHADVILGKILEGWEQTGGAGPQLKLASLYVDQYPSASIAREMAAKYDVPVFDSIEGAVTVGTAGIPVDGVISIGEHGDYPWNDLGQHLYPRRRFFDAIADVFEKYDRVVPVFNDKHLGPEWKDALAMYQRARRMKIPLMAGSSLPVGHRTTAATIPMNCKPVAAVGIGYSGLDIYGIHALEFFQWHLERRRGAETGVRRVRGLQGPEVWTLVDEGVISEKLLQAAWDKVPVREGATLRGDQDAAVFLFEYNDGFRAAQFMLPSAAGTGIAMEMEDGGVFTSVFDERTKPKYPHFAYLLKAIERMVHTGRPTYPVERTLLTGGVLDRALTSLHEGGAWRDTPELAISYQPVDYPFAEHADLSASPRPR